MAPPAVILLYGPTAAGKSEAAVTLAQRLGAEIVNADSAQVYRELEIGTAKPTAEQRAQIPHWMVDVASIHQSFTVQTWLDGARAAIQAIHAKGRPVVVCGGTGLYFKALTQGFSTGPAANPTLRATYQTIIDTSGPAALHQRLLKLDTKGAAQIHPADTVRVMRALEVLESTGRPLRDWWRESTRPQMNTFHAGLTLPRQRLYERIDTRSDTMLAHGLVAEALRLIAAGWQADLPSARILGYRHVHEMVSGQFSGSRLPYLLARDTRRFAKRQLTLFRHLPGATWFENAERLTDYCVDQLVSG